MRLRVLGCGYSSGVPRIGGDWGYCNPRDARNARSRASVLVEDGDVRLLVDTGPDLRTQLLIAEVGSVTAVLYTHAHADHCHGIDDLRPLFHATKTPIDCYMDDATRAQLLLRFSYVFKGNLGYPPTAVAHPLAPVLQFGRVVVRPFRQQHGPIESTGYRFEAGGAAIAYSTDVHTMPEESWPLLENLDLWVVDALRRAPHPTHSHLAQTLGWVERARPREAWLTHMDNSMDCSALESELPVGVSPAWDGRTWEA